MNFAVNNLKDWLVSIRLPRWLSLISSDKHKMAQFEEDFHCQRDTNEEDISSLNLNQENDIFLFLSA